MSNSENTNNGTPDFTTRWELPNPGGNPSESDSFQQLEQTVTQPDAPTAASGGTGADSNDGPGGAVVTSPETVTLSGSQLVFVNTYSASVTDAYRTAILYAEHELQSHFSNNVTIRVSFGFANLGSNFLAQNSFHNTVQASYANLRSALAAHATTADDTAAVNSLPTTDPSGGTGYLVAGGMARLLGLPGAGSNAGNDLDLVLGSAFTWNFDPNNRAAPNGYDAIGAIEHEISEGGFGRVGGLGYQNHNWGPMDLFRYSSPGQRDYTGGRDGLTTYFSVNGSNLLTRFHNSVNTSGVFDGQDPADWDIGGDSFGFGGKGVVGVLSSVDLRVLDILGWTPTGSTPPPPIDDFRNSLTDTTHPFGSVAVNGSSTGTLEVIGDRDWFQVQLTAGTSYLITVQGQQGGGGTLEDSYLRVHNSAGTLLAENDDIVLGVNRDSQLTFSATTTGTYYLDVGAFNDSYAGTYRVSVAVAAAADDFRNSLTDTTHPFGSVTVNGSSTGNLEVNGDRDWFQIQLVAGASYVINLQGQQGGGGTLVDPYLRVHNSSGTLLAENDDIDLGINRDSRLTFTATTTGTYYLEAGAFDEAYTGTYRLSVAQTTLFDDYANSLNDVTRPFGSVPINGSSTGTLETTGDRDWFRVQLVAGTTYVIDLQGQHAGAGTLPDPYLRVHDANGNLLAQNDDSVPGSNFDSEVTFQAGTTGTYYLEAGAFADSYTGTYRLSIAGGNRPLIQDFDPNFYLRTYTDVAAAVPAGTDPATFALQHYNTFGWHEGRNPDADFNTAAYLNTYTDVRAAGVNPLQHYEQFGWHEGRDPSAQFSTSLYLLHNPDVRAAGIDPLQHYLQFGINEGRAAPAAIGHGGEIGDFDPHYYLLAYADVAAAVPAGADPNAFALQHYNTFGWHEGRNPNADFSTSGYLNAYTDVRAAGVNPLDHYHTNGWHEGRDPSPQFDTHQYLAHYTDVAAANIDPLQHYLTNGAWENRLTFGDGRFG